MPTAPEATAPDAPAPAAWRRAWWLLGGLALALRLFDLGRHELWVDEGSTYYFARLLGDLQLGEQLRLEPTPPLYYALIGLLLRLCGDSDLVMRLPSALFGAASAPLVALLGDRLGWRRAGFFGGALLALHPLHLFLSREARVYPLLLMLVLLLAIALWRALEPGAPARTWLAVGGLLTLCLWSHLFGVFVGVTAAFLVLVLAEGRSRRLGLAAVAAAFLLFTPYLVAALPALEDSGAAWSQEVFYQNFPPEGGLPRIYEGQLIGARYNPLQRQLSLPETPPLLRWPPLLAQSLLLLAAISLAWRGEQEDRRSDRRALLFACSFYLLPFLLPWAAGLIRGKVFLQAGRHDFLVLGPLCLLLGAGFETLRRRSRAIAWLVVLPIAAGALFRLAWLHVLPSPKPATERGAFLAAAAGPDDLAIAFDIERLLGERYTRLAGGALPFRSFPGETDRHPGYSDPRAFFGHLPELRAEARALIAERSGRGRLLLLERSPLVDSSGRAGGQEPDEIFIQALREAGWRPDETRDDLRLQIWSSP